MGFGISRNSIPAILNSGLNSADLTTAWDQVYERGKSTAIKLIVVSSSAFFISAYEVHRTKPYATTILGLYQWKQLGLAGVAAIGGAAFTVGYMLTRSVNKNKANLELVAEADRKGLVRSSMLDIETAKRDVASWQGQNSFRAAIFAVGFILGVTAL